MVIIIKSNDAVLASEEKDEEIAPILNWKFSSISSMIMMILNQGSQKLFGGEKCSNHANSSTLSRMVIGLVVVAWFHDDCLL